MAETLTLQIPEAIDRRLVATAQATQRPLEEIVLRVLEVGSPPVWSDVPEEYQSDLAILDGLADEVLWQIVHQRPSRDAARRFEQLLESAEALTPTQQRELEDWQAESDRLMLRKAQAAALLRWRGRAIFLPA